MWKAIEARVIENDNERPDVRRRVILKTLQSLLVRPNGGETKKMVGFEAGLGHRLAWELTGAACNMFVSANWGPVLEKGRIPFTPRPYDHAKKDGGRHSGLNRAWSFAGEDCLCVTIHGAADVDALVSALTHAQ